MWRENRDLSGLGRFSVWFWVSPLRMVCVSVFLSVRLVSLCPSCVSLSVLSVRLVCLCPCAGCTAFWSVLPCRVKAPFPSLLSFLLLMSSWCWFLVLLFFGSFLRVLFLRLRAGSPALRRTRFRPCERAGGAGGFSCGGRTEICRRPFFCLVLGESSPHWWCVSVCFVCPSCLSVRLVSLSVLSLCPSCCLSVSMRGLYCFLVRLAAVQL